MIPALLLAVAVNAPSVPALTVSVRLPPDVGLNARGESRITVQAGQKRWSFPLSGVHDPASPDTFRAARPLSVRLPAGVRGPVTVHARLFLCDRRNGLCTVQEQARRVTLKPGATVPVVMSVTAPR